MEKVSKKKTSNAACRIGERDVKKCKTETNEATADRKFVLDGESGRKERKKKTKDQIYESLAKLIGGGISPARLPQKTADRSEWRLMVANALGDTALR